MWTELNSSMLKLQVLQNVINEQQQKERDRIVQRGIERIQALLKKK